MRVLISGAGIAGLTTAYWLRQYGFTPTIIERAPSLPTGGYKIDVRGKALDVLRRMDVYDEVVAASTDMQGALLVDKEGKIIQEMSGNEFGHRVDNDVEIIRGALCQILMNKVSDVEYIFGDVIQGVTQLPDCVQVEFKKNEARTFDFVIGADGLHSNVRRLAFGEESQFLHQLGIYLCVFTVPNYLNLDRVEMQYTEFGRIAAVWSAHGEPNAKACFGFTAPSTQIDLNNVTQQQQILKTIYQGIGWEVPKFLSLMSDSTDFYFDTSAQVHMDCWSQGRVVLAGDAGYCPSPMSGQGTSLALIGGYILAGEMAAAKDNYQDAFTQYEKQMRSFVNINQDLGMKAAKRMRSQDNVFTGWILKQFMRIAPGKLIKFIIDLSTRRITKAANAITFKEY